jgi:uncharacterized damage-inducible protein DinB
MAEEFVDRDLSGAVFWAVDLSGARFRDVNMTDVTITHAWVVNVEIDALVDHVTINGVDVTQYVNERDRWYPLRAMLRPTEPDGFGAAWQALEKEWASTIERARQLTEPRRHESVGGEWSVVDTLRHLVFAMDKWFTVPILGDEEFDPLGLPNTGSADFGWLGLDRRADPSFDEVLDVRARRTARFREFLDTVTSTDLVREVDVLENGTTPVNECLYTVFEEEFHHNRYALRDLSRLDN